MTEYFLGVELSGNKFKIASFIKRGRGYSLLNLDTLETSEDTDVLSESIKNWLKENKLLDENINASITVPESSIFLKEITLPKKNEQKIDQMAYWELASVSTIAMEEVIYDWKKIDEEKGSVNILAVTLRSSKIKAILEAFKNAGVKVVAVEPSALAFSKIADINFDRTTLLLTVESDETNLLVLKKGIPVFTTSVSVVLKSSRNDRRKLGKTVLHDLAVNTKKIIDFWEEKQKAEIEQVVITGDIANKYYGLATSINKFIKVPVFLAKAKKLNKIILSGFAKNIIERNFIPIAAALRAINPQIEKMNLFPFDIKKIYEKEKNTLNLLSDIRLLNYLAFVVLLVIIICLALLKYYNNNLQKKILQSQKFVDNHPAQEYLTEVNSTNTLAQRVNNLILTQEDAGVKLKQIANDTPAGITLTAVEYQDPVNKIWNIEGTGSRQDILAYYTKLKSDLAQSEVGLDYSGLSKLNDNQFSLHIIWK